MSGPRLIATLLVILALAIPMRGQDADGNAPTSFDTYWMVFLLRGDDPPKLDDEAAVELQRRHLAHLSKVRDEGYSLAAGPFEVPAGEPMRGIVIYRGDLERQQVVDLASDDPAVRAGRLKVEVRKWWTPAGVLSFPGAEDSGQAAGDRP